jgi:hypothetical protein
VIEGTASTTAAKVADAIDAAGPVVATADGPRVDCACAQPLDATTADPGFVSVAPE